MKHSSDTFHIWSRTSQHKQYHLPQGRGGEYYSYSPSSPTRYKQYFYIITCNIIISSNTDTATVSVAIT